MRSRGLIDVEGLDRMFFYALEKLAGHLAAIEAAADEAASPNIPCHPQRAVLQKAMSISAWVVMGSTEIRC